MYQAHGAVLFTINVAHIFHTKDDTMTRTYTWYILIKLHSSPGPCSSYRVSLADLILSKIEVAALVQRDLAGLAAVALSSQSPDPVATLDAVGCLEAPRHKCVAIDATNLLPATGATAMVDTH